LHSHFPLNKLSVVAFVACGVFVALEVVTAQAPPAPPHSVSDGVYTQDQAKRGEDAYVQKCARCHGTDLHSGDAAPPLVGTDFLSNWNQKTMGDLFERVRTTMPSDKPGSLNRQQVADILSYILSENKFPAGKDELGTQADALKQIQIDAYKQQ
jgi:S-disulfanyl-L-cysteine oxidoreductase SoxD